MESIVNVEEMANFIKESRKSYTEATGQLAEDKEVSHYAMAYQLAVLNENLEVLMEVVDPEIIEKLAKSTENVVQEEK
jgi:hypothetical protein